MPDSCTDHHLLLLYCSHCCCCCSPCQPLPPLHCRCAVALPIAHHVQVTGRECMRAPRLPQSGNSLLVRESIDAARRWTWWTGASATPRSRCGLRCLQCSSLWPQDGPTLHCLHCTLLCMHVRLSVCVACKALCALLDGSTLAPHRLMQEVFIRITREAGVRMSAFA